MAMKRLEMPQCAPWIPRHVVGPWGATDARCFIQNPYGREERDAVQTTDEIIRRIMGGQHANPNRF